MNKHVWITHDLAQKIRKEQKEGICQKLQSPAKEIAKDAKEPSPTTPPTKTI